MRLEISSSRRVKDAANGLVNYLLWFVLRGRAYSLVDLGPPPLFLDQTEAPPPYIIGLDPPLLLLSGYSLSA